MRLMTTTVTSKQKPKSAKMRKTVRRVVAAVVAVEVVGAGEAEMARVKKVVYQNNDQHQRLVARQTMMIWKMMTKFWTLMLI